MSKKLTPEEKKYKQDLDDWLVAKNRALTGHSFKHIITYEDLLHSVGHDRESLRTYYPADQLAATIDRQQVIDFFEPYKQRIETEFSTRDVPLCTLNGVSDFEWEGISYGATKAKEIEQTGELAVGPVVFTEDELRECEEHEKLPPCARQKCVLFPFQERAARKLLDGIVLHGKWGQLLRAAVGTGKTFIVGAVIARLLDMKFCQGKTFSPWAMAYITRASIVEQTRRVLAEQFGIDVLNECQVINIEQLRASFGELMVRSEITIEQGEEHVKWKWRPNVHPLILFLDECQSVKNTDSQQSQILQAFNDIPNVHTHQIYFSATPFMRVNEAKCFAVSTRTMHKYGVSNVPLSNETWHEFATKVAKPADPIEYSPPAVERLMEKLNDYIVDVKGVRSQFKAINTVQTITFKTAEEAEFYHKAWQRYEAMKMKIEGYDLSSSQSRFLILAQFTVFRRAAEICRAPHLAEAMYQAVQTGKQVACCAVCFKGTIRRAVEILVNDYGVSRDDISLIWGGGKTAKTKKQKAKEAIVTNQALQEVLKDIGIGLTDLNLADVEDYIDEEDDPKLRLGTQSMKERTREIDKFQRGDSHYCFFTFKAGGVGLSLHHCDELTKEKARRKKNGWVVLEDIPKIPTLQRVCFLAPTFSAIELVQGLGRCPRLTSFSDTPQVVIFYAGTIEERVAAIVSMKLRCLRKVVRTRESWEDCIVGGVPESEQTKVPAELKNTGTVPDEDDAEADGFFGDDEEDEE